MKIWVQADPVGEFVPQAESDTTSRSTVTYFIHSLRIFRCIYDDPGRNVAR